MRVRAILIVLACVLTLVAAAHAANAGPSPNAPRYIALGDSLAASYQPHGSSDRGYVERLAAREARRHRPVVLTKLGRGGETAASMIRSGRRAGPSQLQQAEAVLGQRRVALVTIDIGANEVEGCQSGDGFDQRCVQGALASLRRNLPVVLSRLRAAGGARLTIVGMTYYNSFLGQWVRGTKGRRLARNSVPVERAMNAALTQVYRRAGVPVADVERAFATSRVGPPNVSNGRRAPAPLAVANVCKWTWSCDEDDDHTNSLGYERLADEVERARPALHISGPGPTHP